MHRRIRAVCLTGAAVVPAVGLARLLTHRVRSGREGARGRVEHHRGLRRKLRAWTSRVDGMMRVGELRVRPDARGYAARRAAPSARRPDDRGVRVFGGDIARQTAERRHRVPCSARSTRGSSIVAPPVLDEDRARAILAARTGAARSRSVAAADRASARCRRVCADLARRVTTRGDRASTSSTRGRAPRPRLQRSGRTERRSGAPPACSATPRRSA